MNGLGFIREKLDIKILILFILQRLPEPVDLETLAGLTRQEDTVGWFDFTECLAELEESDHIVQERGGWRITPKGERNSRMVESSLPWCVRSRTEKLVSPVAARLRRDAMIVTEHRVLDDGTAMAELSLSDGKGPMLRLSVLCAGEAQAAEIETRFRTQAEQTYARIMRLLTADEAL